MTSTGVRSVQTTPTRSSRSATSESSTGDFADGFSKAEPIYRQVLEARRHTLGEHHDATIQAGVDLADLYTRAGHTSDARAAGRDVIRQCEDVAARADADPMTLDKCAGFYLAAEPPDLRSPTRALDLAQRAVDMEHRTHYARLATLARAHQALGQPAEAIAILREGLALPQAIQSWFNEALLVDLLREHGTPEELERWLLDRLGQFRHLRGPDDHFMAYTLGHLARLYARQGRAPEAEARFAERLAQLRKTAPETNWQVARAKTELGEQMVVRGALRRGRSAAARRHDRLACRSLRHRPPVGRGARADREALQRVEPAGRCRRVATTRAALTGPPFFTGAERRTDCSPARRKA